MRTRVTEMFGIDLPIFAFSHCRDVVAAVSRAGGMGVLGALYFTPEELETELRWIDEHVDGRPYGVDVVMPASYAGSDLGVDSPAELVAKLQAMIPEGHRRFVEDLLARHGVPPLSSDAEPGRVLLGWTDATGRPQVEVALKHPIALLANAGLRNQLGLGPALHESSSSSPSPTEPPPPGIGDPVRDTTVEFRVTEVSCGHSTVGEGVFTRRARGQYCVASYELRNVGNTLAILTVNDQFAVTTAGSRHRANADATAAANDLLFVLPLPLAPGDSSAGKIVFDIPADATLATLELHDSGRSDGVVITVNLA